MGDDVARHRFVLASASPRRHALLNQIGLQPAEIISAEVDETPLTGEIPRNLASRLASAKADALQGHPKTKDAFVLTADTVVGCGRRILMKPDTKDAARASLTLLSGRAHQVFTGLCLTAPDGTARKRLVATRVTFKRLSIDEINAYVAGGEWQGKAGGYAIQGVAGAFVKSISGSYSNVVGLPLFETANLLQGSGYPLSFTPLNAA